MLTVLFLATTLVLAHAAPLTTTSDDSKTLLDEDSARLLAAHIRGDIKKSAPAVSFEDRIAAGRAWLASLPNVSSAPQSVRPDSSVRVSTTAPDADDGTAATIDTNTVVR
jgi:hypothetical protein